MTKYLLHSGNIRGAADGGKDFFQAVAKGLGKEPHILLCFFAHPEDLWQEKFIEWSGRMAEAIMPAVPQFELAQISSFIQQAKRSDAILLYGGDCRLFMERAKQIDGFSEVLQTVPVVAGASAGTVLLARLHWCCDYRTIHDGLGIVPINCMVHYRNPWYADNSPLGPIDWDAADSAIEKRSRDDQVIKIPEGEFRVFEQ